MRVLVVEDDPDLAEYACAVLRRDGNVTVEVAYNGRMALESFHGRGADILITDIELPGMTGIELATSIRQADPDMPMAMMTAHASVDYAVTALRNQIDEFLVKPVSAAEFRATLLRLRALRTRPGCGQRFGRSCWPSARTPTMWKSVSAACWLRTVRPVIRWSSSRCPAVIAGAAPSSGSTSRWLPPS